MSISVEEKLERSEIDLDRQIRRTERLGEALRRARIEMAQIQHLNSELRHQNAKAEEKLEKSQEELRREKQRSEGLREGLRRAGIEMAEIQHLNSDLPQQNGAAKPRHEKTPTEDENVEMSVKKPDEK